MIKLVEDMKRFARLSKGEKWVGEEEWLQYGLLSRANHRYRCLRT